MIQKAEELWEILSNAGIVQGMASKTSQLESPWYVKTLLAFSGWLASIFLLAFIGLTLFRDTNTFVFSIIGSLMIIGAIFILRTSRNEFFEHLALALSLAGQALIVWVIFELMKFDNASAWLLFVIMEVSLAIIVPNFVHRVFSTAIATYAFSKFLLFVGEPYAFGGLTMALIAWIWLNEFRYIKHIRKMQAIGYGLVLAIIFLTSMSMFGHEILGWLLKDKRNEFWIQPWMGELVIGAVMIYITWNILKARDHISFSRVSVIVLLAVSFLCIVSMEAKGITLGMSIILLGFAGGNRILLGLGIASLLFYISSYYYLLDATLLSKAKTLMIIGITLFAARWLILQALSKVEAVNSE